MKISREDLFKKKNKETVNVTSRIDKIITNVEKMQDQHLKLLKDVEKTLETTGTSLHFFSAVIIGGFTAIVIIKFFLNK